jgi:hypothetical protein
MIQSIVSYCMIQSIVSNDISFALFTTTLLTSFYKGNNKITEHPTILQRESQNSCERWYFAHIWKPLPLQYNFAKKGDLDSVPVQIQESERSCLSVLGYQFCFRFYDLSIRLRSCSDSVAFLLFFFILSYLCINICLNVCINKYVIFFFISSYLCINKYGILIYFKRHKNQSAV